MDWALATNFLVALLGITNPMGKIPMWLEGAGDEPLRVRWRLALMVIGTGGGVLLACLLLGRRILEAFSIDLASFRVGGGVIILILAIGMIRSGASQVETGEPDREAHPLREAKTRFRQIVVPLAIPLIAGPGSITTVILFATKSAGLAQTGLLAGVLAVVMLLILATLLGAERVQRVVGDVGLEVVTRVFGLILAGIAAQLILEGIAEAFPLLTGGGSPVAPTPAPTPTPGAGS